MTHHVTHLNHELLILQKPPYCARYKDRYPDPGECKVISIDWEEGRVAMSNGQCRYWPEFSEINIYKDPHPLIAQMKKISDHIDSLPESYWEEFKQKCQEETLARYAKLSLPRGYRFLEENELIELGDLEPSGYDEDSWSLYEDETAIPWLKHEAPLIRLIRQ